MSRLASGVAAALIAPALVFGSAAAFAADNPPCGKRTDLLKHLASRFSEAPVASGVTENGGMVEVLASNDGATWTLLVTVPGGLTCLLAAGEGWENLPRIAQSDPGI